MPAQTETFDITYPCSGETIDPAIFCAHAYSVEFALGTVAATIDEALNPPAAQVRRESAQLINAGVTTVATYGVEAYDTNAIWSPGSPTILLIPENGTYLITLRTDYSPTVTTITSVRSAILLDAVEVAYHESDLGTIDAEYSRNIQVSVMLPALTVGQQITSNMRFTGAGAINTFSSYFSIIKVANV